MKHVNIFNRTRGISLAESGLSTERFFERLKGLMFRDTIKEGEGLFIERCNSIHTFFMKFPIDVIFISSDGRVVDMVEGMPPFRVSKIFFDACAVVELPAGTIRRSGTSKGDLIDIVPFEKGRAIWNS